MDKLVPRSCNMHLKLLYWHILPSWKRLWILVFLYLTVQNVSYALKYSDKTSKHYTFRHAKQEQFAKDLNEYEISIPTRVSVDGDFISHSVHHLRTVTDFPSSSGRHRRDIRFEPETPLYYKINVNDANLHVKLHPNHNLLGPGFVVQKRPQGYRNISHTHITTMVDNPCYFQGHVKGHPGSRVAIATCHGLHGYLHTGNGQYMIEPVKGHDYTQGGEHPHLVYHRASLPAHLDITRATKNQTTNQTSGGASSACGVDGTYDIATKERDVWQKENVLSKGHHRSRRSVSMERYVELLVVVDKEMMQFYENEDVSTYVLTIMNMVSMLYHDSTLGNAVNIQLVNLMLMDYDEEKLTITHHADNTLRSFCKWQKSINPKEDKDPMHHDVAVLLTRRNICAKMNEPCSTLGLSQVNGLCQPHRSCNINEDTGLSLAFTVAHELGHNFGMQHDGEGNTCHSESGKFQLLMQAQLNAEASPMIWSTCSKASITKFLDRDWGFCLGDTASKQDYVFDERPPGIIYDADHQCRLQYGEEAEHCKVDNLCVTLWCKVKNKCMTRLEAAAEGTICGDNKWCSAGRCVLQGETPLATNGEWGEWGSWSGCSRSCGAGVAYRERHCDNPPPKNDGQYCLGERKRYRVCNTDECPEETLSFKDFQCKEFNEKPYKGKMYDWEYVANPRTPCQLHCRPKNQFFSVMLKDMVSDGTPCPIRGKRSMCISGICRHVGCDWGIDSRAKEDRCGVCRGDGSSCKTVITNFDEEQGMGYVEAMVIPQGARNIRVEEVAEANNYLAVKNDNGEYYLNGGWFIQWNGDYEAGGTVMTYERVGDKEMLKAPGPLKESLHIMLLFQSENPGVEFRYTIPNENATSDRLLEFRWVFLDWTHCTHSCGGGLQRSEVACRETQDGLVDDIYCDASTRPDDMIRICNEHSCPPRWWPGPWQHCSKTCGNDGVRIRTVLCVRSSGSDAQVALESHECEGQEKPASMEPCSNKPQCPPSFSGRWSTARWSQCTRSCGRGIQMREVTCVGGLASSTSTSDNTESQCDLELRPMAQRECNVHPCQQAISGGRYGVDDGIHVNLNQDLADPDQINSQNEESIHDDTFVDIATDTKILSNMNSDFEAENIQEPTENKENLHVTHAGPESSTTSAQSTSTISELHVNTEGHKNSRLLNMKGKVVDMFNKVNIVQDTPVPSSSSSVSTSTSTSTTSTTMRTTSTTTSTTTTTTTEPEYYIWVPLFWYECSKPCGGGSRTRPVRCFHNETLEQVPEVNCQGQAMPDSEEPCNEHDCLDWEYSDWSQCSESCSEGVSTRSVYCPIRNQCDVTKKPRDHSTCMVRPCIDWVPQPWSECSKSCGNGHKTREVECRDLRSNESATDCNIHARPSKHSRCNSWPCQAQNAASSSNSAANHFCRGDLMNIKVCHALRRMGRCWHDEVKIKCCRTCRVGGTLTANHRRLMQQSPNQNRAPSSNSDISQRRRNIAKGRRRKKIKQRHESSRQRHSGV